MDEHKKITKQESLGPATERMTEFLTSVVKQTSLREREHSQATPDIEDQNSIHKKQINGQKNYKTEMQSLPNVAELNFVNKTDNRRSARKAKEPHMQSNSNLKGPNVTKLNTKLIKNHPQVKRFESEDLGQQLGVSLSKFSPRHQTPTADDLERIKDGNELSMDEDMAESTEDPDALVKFGVDMTELSEYLDNIIQVVNQHAKLLDKVNDELEIRPKANVVGELFSILSHAYPYERSLHQMQM